MTRAESACLTLAAAVGTALIGRLVLGEPSVGWTIVVALLAAALVIAVVEAVDELEPAAKSIAPARPGPVPPTWWDRSARAAVTPNTTPTATLATLSEVAHASVGSPAAARPRVDLERFARRSPGRVAECPSCGGFAVVRSSSNPSRFGCRDCRVRWTWRSGLPWPRVTVDVVARARARQLRAVEQVSGGS